MADLARVGLHCPEQPVLKSSVAFITEASRQSDANIQADGFPCKVYLKTPRRCNL